MKDNFIVYFNIKKVALWSLVSTIFTLVSVHIATLPSAEVPDTARLPHGGRIKSKFIIKIIMIVGSLFFGVASLLLILLLIKIILNRLFLRKEETEFLVIDNKGILIKNQLNIFSKPMLIEWEHIEDVCVYNPLQNSRYNPKYFRNKSIALKLSQQFRNNLSLFTRILHKLNEILSHDYELHISLGLSDFNADEVLDEIYKYCFT